MADFQLDWTPGASATNQNVQYREKGSSTWIDSVNIDPINPQTNTNDTVDVNGLNNNTVYQFRVETNQTSKSPAYSDTKEKIDFDCSAPYDTNIAGGIITFSFLSNFPTIDKIICNLIVASTEDLVESIECTGEEASVTFDTVASGTYKVRYYFNASIDGVGVTSVDQLGVQCETTNIVVT